MIKFKFSHPRSNRYYRDTRLEKEVPLGEAIFYTDPFYAECRAYGKIQQGLDTGDVKTHIAVKCHGYLYLKAEDKRWIKNLDLEYRLLDDELRQALGDTRVRAIVKSLDKDPRKVDAENVKKAWQRLFLLNHSLKIYNMDIKADNFINYRLVDFGSSWTEPHILLEYLEKDIPTTARAKKSRDRTNFQNMIDDEEIPTKLRVRPSSRHQLRSRGEPAWAHRDLPKQRRQARV